MSPTRQQPRIVAELGRPETPEETAARKAENSRNHRNRQTLNNLVYSLLVTVALVAVIFLLVPRGHPDTVTPVDYAAVAAEAQGSEPDPLVSPTLPADWHANDAELRTKTADGIDAWYIGLITPKQQYVGITQGFNANPSWLADLLEKSAADRSVTIAGVQWTVYDNRDSGSDHGNVQYALTTEAGHSTFALVGTAEPAEFTVAAKALAGEITTDATKGRG